MLHSFRAAVTAARRHGDLYFAVLLSEQSILNALGSASSLWQGWVYTPAVTVWVFLSQCSRADHSCRDAVARLAAWRVAKGLSPCSAETGATASRGRICRRKPAVSWFDKRAAARSAHSRPAARLPHEKPRLFVSLTR